MLLEKNELIDLICDRTAKGVDDFSFESDSPDPEVLSGVFQDSDVQQKMCERDSQLSFTKKAKSKKGVINTTIELKVVMKYQSKADPKPKRRLKFFRRASFRD